MFIIGVCGMGLLGVVAATVFARIGALGTTTNLTSLWWSFQLRCTLYWWSRFSHCNSTYSMSSSYSSTLSSNSSLHFSRRQLLVSYILFYTISPLIELKPIVYTFLPSYYLLHLIPSQEYYTYG